MIKHILLVPGIILFLLLAIHPSRQSNPSPQNKNQTHNRLTAKELEQGWVLLFDGQTTNGWRGFKKDGIGEGWQVMDGNLVALGKGGDLGGDIITLDQYEDFELYLEWAISEAGNSGIFFHVLENDYPTVYATGPEYQLLDDTGYPDKLEDWQLTGANYAMHLAYNKVLMPVGEFNSSRIVVRDRIVQHWLNGNMLLEYELWTDEWKAMVGESKWKDFPGYGLALSGHIGLQDHGSVVRFRDIKIRDLTDHGNSLFNGKNLEGWKVNGKEKWYVEEGNLVCESGPEKGYGYLSTAKEYKDFILRLQFKQEADGNSGVFFRSSVEDTRIEGWQVEVAPRGKDTGGIYESYGRGWLVQIPDNKENVLIEGEWNSLVILVNGDRVMTWLNNELMADLEDEAIGNATGSIALQIHDGGGIKVRWRDIYLREL
jgi:hypothetical protein